MEYLQYEILTPDIAFFKYVFKFWSGWKFGVYTLLS